MMKLASLFLSACSLSLWSSVAQAEQTDILLITSTELSKSWEPFAEWKLKQGKRTQVVTVAEIEKNYQGVDIQDKIRQCAREYIDTKQTKWLILGGDSQPGGLGVVPDRDTVHQTRWGKNVDIPTDIYYLSATSWDADKDGVYGEFEDDREAISYPDGSIGLGRIPVRTAADVRAYTDKVISYESKYPKGAFRDSIVFTCTVAGAYPKVRRSWDDHVSKVLPEERMAQYFANKTPWDGEQAGDYPLSPKNWVKMLNQKSVGKYHFHGHGLLHGWALEKDKMFTQKHVDELTNKDAYPIITTVSCFTGHYDAEKDPCISESMLRKAEGGAIAIVAPCREGKPHFMNPKVDFPLMVSEGKMDGTTRTMTYFWELGIKNRLSTGEALMQSKARMVDEGKESAMFHMCLSELNLLGDPTLAVHPQQSEVE